MDMHEQYNHNMNPWTRYRQGQFFLTDMPDEQYIHEECNTGKSCKLNSLDKATRNNLFIWISQKMCTQPESRFFSKSKARKASSSTGKLITTAKFSLKACSCIEGHQQQSNRPSCDLICVAWLYVWQYSKPCPFPKQRTKGQPNTTEDKGGIHYEPGPLPLGRFTMDKLIGEGVSGVGYAPKLRWVGEGPEEKVHIIHSSQRN